uniref:RxLR effector candidate protein n=2 Tax=Hyaloperonospora arabidopsidis (strain Emoy2) TaxID=559515 RepID=M4BDA1_HYAAE|nr:RxLR effector candidate protein [Hyaloperonospora arabidopsidis Emoy2]
MLPTLAGSMASQLTSRWILDSASTRILWDAFVWLHVNRNGRKTLSLWKKLWPGPGASFSVRTSAAYCCCKSGSTSSARSTASFTTGYLRLASLVLATNRFEAVGAERVMSPMAKTTDTKPRLARTGHARASPDRGASPARVASSARASEAVEDSSVRERSSATDDKILAALAALTNRMAKMESSQREREDHERMLGAVQSGMFASALGANARPRPMTIDALTDSPENKPAPRPLRARVPDLEESMFASFAPACARTPTPAEARRPAAGPAPSGQPPATTASYATPNEIQRKLSIRKLDGSELYKGIGSGFLDWGRKFLCAINLAESSCGFTWSEDVKVDLLVITSAELLSDITTRR